MATLNGLATYIPFCGLSESERTTAVLAGVALALFLLLAFDFLVGFWYWTKRSKR